MLTYEGSDHIGVEIQHKDPSLADARAIGAVLAAENDAVPFDRPHVLLQRLIEALPRRHQAERTVFGSGWRAGCLKKRPS